MSSSGSTGEAPISVQLPPPPPVYYSSTGSSGSSSLSTPDITPTSLTQDLSVSSGATSSGATSSGATSSGADAPVFSGATSSGAILPSVPELPSGPAVATQYLLDSVAADAFKNAYTDTGSTKLPTVGVSTPYYGKPGSTTASLPPQYQSMIFNSTGWPPNTTMDLETGNVVVYPDLSETTSGASVSGASSAQLSLTDVYSAIYILDQKMTYIINLISSKEPVPPNEPVPPKEPVNMSNEPNDETNNVNMSDPLNMSENYEEQGGGYRKKPRKSRQKRYMHAGPKRVTRRRR